MGELTFKKIIQCSADKRAGAHIHSLQIRAAVVLNKGPQKQRFYRIIVHRNRLLINGLCLRLLTKTLRIWCLKS